MISHHLNRALRRRRKAIDLSLLSSLPESLLSSNGGEWTLANTQTALLVVFMLACFESLIGIGLFVSGVFLLGIASYLLSQDIISSTQLAITAAGGAILGDHVGFFFGRFLGPRLHHTRLFIRHADRILKTEDMIARWGGIAVPIGRFVPAIRSIVPALLGTSGFMPKRFILIDTLSCATWAGALVLLATGIDRIV